MNNLKVYRESFSFIERGGLYAGDNFLNWIREKLDSKSSGLGDATLSDFHSSTGNDLSLVASDTTGQEMLVLNHRTAPKVPVSLAVRMSMSIPFVWQEVIWEEIWGTYCGRNITGHTIVDGGLLSNFPINLLTSTNNEVKTIMGNTDPSAVPNLGLLVDENLEVKDSGTAIENCADGSEGELVDDFKRLKTVQRINRLVNTMTNAHDRLSIREHSDEICRLPAKGYGTTEFSMSAERLKALVNAGRNAMKEYFDKHLS